jgi:HPt (histidine-containing phosphotransfer) domain-containing protein
MAGETPPVDLSAALKSVGGNEELLGELIKIFLEELPRRLDAIRHALSRGDAEESRRVAHNLKGALTMLGAAEARALARQVEGLADTRQLKAATQLVESFALELERVAAFLRSTQAEDRARS